MDLATSISVRQLVELSEQNPSLRYTSMLQQTNAYGLSGLVVMGPPQEREKQGSNPAFPSRIIPVTQKSELMWISCQALGVTRSAVVLVGPVSLLRYRIRLHLRSTIFISSQQYLRLLEQIRSEIHSHIAFALSSQACNKQTLLPRSSHRWSSNEL